MKYFRRGALAFVDGDYEKSLVHLHRAVRFRDPEENKKAKRLIALLKIIIPYTDIPTMPKNINDLLKLKDYLPLLWVDCLSMLIRNPAFLDPKRYMSNTTVKNFPRFLVVHQSPPQGEYCCNSHPRNLEENQLITIHYVSWLITRKYYYGVNLCHACYHLCKEAFKNHFVK